MSTKNGYWVHLEVVPIQSCGHLKMAAMAAWLVADQHAIEATFWRMAGACLALARAPRRCLFNDFGRSNNFRQS